MYKRYQVFVSSTYTDLIEERKCVFNILLSLPCIAAGMEWFPAETDEQWTVIRKVIDDSDFYVLIIGGRYGSTTTEGLSYTEKEFDYAVGKSMPVLVFCHQDPSSIPLGKSEVEPTLRLRLEAFRQKAMSGRMVKFWATADGLAGQVSVAIQHVISTQNAVGWIRANGRDGTRPSKRLQDANAEILQLRKRNRELRASLRPGLESLEGREKRLTQILQSLGIYQFSDVKNTAIYGTFPKVSWLTIFAIIAEFLDAPKAEPLVYERLEDRIMPSNAYTEVHFRNKFDRNIEFKNAKDFLIGLDLIQTIERSDSQNRVMEFWQLSKAGHRLFTTVSQSVQGGKARL